MNTAAASVPAVSASVIRVTAPAAATRPRASVTRGHGRWLATAAAAAIVVLTALTLVLNALEAQEGAEYGPVATNVASTGR
jgi:hypothetical protein